MTGYGMSLGCQCCGCTLFVLDGRATQTHPPGFPDTPADQIAAYSQDASVLTYVPDAFSFGFGAYELQGNDTWVCSVKMPASAATLFLQNILPVGSGLTLIDVVIRLVEIIDDETDGNVYEHRLYYDVVDGGELKRTELSGPLNEAEAFGFAFREGNDVQMLLSEHTVASGAPRWLGDPPSDVYSINLHQTNQFQLDRFMPAGLSCRRVNYRSFRLELENQSEVAVRFQNFIGEKFLFRGASFDNASQYIEKNNRCLTTVGVHLENPVSAPKTITTTSSVGDGAPYRAFVAPMFTRNESSQYVPILESLVTGTYNPENPTIFSGARNLELSIGHTAYLEFQSPVVDDITGVITDYLVDVVVTLLYYAPQSYIEGSENLLTLIFRRGICSPAPSSPWVVNPLAHAAFPGNIMGRDFRPIVNSLPIMFEPPNGTQSVFRWSLKVPAAIARSNFDLELSTENVFGQSIENAQVLSVAFPTLPIQYASVLSLTEQNPEFESPETIDQTMVSTNLELTELSIRVEVRDGIFD